MKKTILSVFAILIFASCTNDKAKQLTPVFNYNVKITATDTIQNSILHGFVKIGNTKINLRNGFDSTVVIDTTITDDASLGFSYNIYISKISPNDILKLDTLNNISLIITGSNLNHTKNGSYLVY